MRRSERGKGRRKLFHTYYDYSLLFLVLFLVGFGLIMIYSTSSFNAERNFGDAAYYLKKQGIFGLLGIGVMLFVSMFDYRLFLKPLPIIRIRLVTLFYLICMGLQVYVLIFGRVVKGSKRWIDLGPFGFQPSELSKVALIVFVSYIIQLAPRKLDKFSGFMRVAVFAAPLLLLVVIPNFSTGLIMGVIFVGICFVASRKKLYFIVAGLLGVAAGAFFIFGVDYRGERIEIWRDIETHPKGYQILQGLYAIASGGVFGKGLGQSMQKLGFIPESHNDMIFSVICEELGLFGAVSVILLYILVIWRLFIIAINAPDLFGGLIATGILTHISIQVLINIAVVTNTIPSTGIPLPFISYGGSSLVFLLFEMGIALSISNQIKYEKA
ncbi:MAG: cell division protein FtsW [Clostridiales bacterium]|nr:cell division protein FtsW [Clostridiales bacterium]